MDNKKRMLIVGDIDVGGGERGRVVSKNASATTISATEYKDPQKTFRRWRRKNDKCFESVMAINAMPNGTARTIKYQYQKNSIGNFLSQGSFGATGVLRRKCEKQ